MILIITGLVFMLVGTIMARIQPKFQNALHYLGISDTAGSIIFLVGLITENFEPLKVLVAIIAILIWNPYVTHFIMKAYLSRVKKNG
jgi:multisubunit Na+/H+ antiporter MnhG subunit